MKKPLFFIVAIIVSFIATGANAQLKRLSRQQIFGGEPAITKQFDFVTGWADGWGGLNFLIKNTNE